MLAATAASAQTTAADSTAAAAAAAPADSSSTAPAAGSRPRRSASQLTSAEIDDAHVSTAYDAVARLRSRWLRNSRSADWRGPIPIPIQVYRNGQSLGTIESLKQIPASDVEMLQWFTPILARSRFGPTAENGAIVVVDKP
ncbi:MAG TPA: hypothetical protein VEX86_17145 [Longimicrobium sp.]|nr:hypothetical protein [Longimicrobium sp.]